MAFFSAPVGAWLYSAVMKTKPSRRSTASAQRLVCALLVLPERGGHRLVEQRQVEVGDVDELELGVRARGGQLVDPAAHRLAVPARDGCCRR